MVQISASDLVTRILDQYKIPFYTMGKPTDPRSPEVRQEPPAEGWEEGLSESDFIVALIDDPADIPEELMQYVQAVRTSEVMLGDKRATDQELRKAFSGGLKTDQLEHDEPSMKPMPEKPEGDDR
jgi:hypothetical protein